MRDYDIGNLAQSLFINLLASVIFAGIGLLVPRVTPQVLVPLAILLSASAIIVRVWQRPRNAVSDQAFRLSVAILLAVLPIVGYNLVLATALNQLDSLPVRFLGSVIVALLSLQLVDYLWFRWHLRYRLIALFQSRWSIRIIAAVPALAITGVITLVVSTLGVFPTTLFSGALAGLEPFALPAAMLVTLLIVYMILRLAVSRSFRPRVNPALIYFVLRQLQRAADSGDAYYRFQEGTPTGEVYSQCRVLDLIAQQRGATPVPQVSAGQVVVTPAWARYRVSRAGQQAIDELTSLPRADEDKEYSTRIEDLVRTANELCQSGDALKRWVKVGPDVPVHPEHLYASKFFGNDLDSLFNGGAGYRIGSSGLHRFVMMVIKGHPGAGKSTAALQLCTTLAKQGHICVYYSLEEEREALLDSAQAFGWRDPSKIVDESTDTLLGSYAGIRYDARAKLYAGIEERVSKLRSSQATPLITGAVLVSSLGNRAMAVRDRMKTLRQEWLLPPAELPRCVVIDSLEGFANQSLDAAANPGLLRSQLLDVKDFFRDRCDILVILAEEDGTGRPGYVDYVADTVIRLGRRDEEGYTILHAEVEKARNQSHALGQHQMKIRSQTDLQLVTAPEIRQQPQSPGVLVYPSLDYILSQSRLRSSSESGILRTGFTGLDALLGSDRAGGMNFQSSAALLGPGSTGKSLIAQNYLIEGVRDNQQTLLLSLRDNEDIVKQRDVPQERGRMRLSWQRSAEGAWLHQIDWDVTGIEGWLKEHANRSSEQDTLRLPYLLRDEIWTTSGTSSAVRAFLDTIATSTEQVQGWNVESCGELQRVFEQARTALITNAGEEARRITLREAPSSDRPPTLQWKSLPLEAGNGHRFDTHLLQIKYWRPGRITPEDFVDWLIRVIGHPNDPDPSPYKRIVFDDATQLAERFPLLAKAKLFLPTLIDLFKARHIVPLFLAGFNEQDPVQASAGLDVLADHVIRTKVQYLVPIDPQGQPVMEDRVLNGEEPHQLYQLLAEGYPRHRATIVDIDARPGVARDNTVYRLHVFSDRGSQPAATSEDLRYATIQKVRIDLSNAGGLKKA